MFVEALGADFTGVLVSDFYAVYTNAEGIRHQYCWAHLLRDVDEVAQAHRHDAGVRGWADAIHRLFVRAQQAATVSELAVRQRTRQELEQALLALCAPYLSAPEGHGAEAPAPATLCRRIEKYLGDLFVFVVEPAVPPTNNAAERALRPLVTCRKISGGTRSATGTATKMTLASLFGTWRLQGRNPLEECHRLLASPQL